jgi:uncharacterized protein YjbJ (UPF0337 family)
MESVMNRDQVKGSIKDAAGRVQEGVGRTTGNGTQQTKGAGKQVAGKVQKAIGNVREGLKGKRSV